MEQIDTRGDVQGAAGVRALGTWWSRCAAVSAGVTHPGPSARPHSPITRPASTATRLAGPRRAFALHLVCAVMLIATAPFARAAAPMEVTIGWIGDKASSAFRGAEQGIEEANRQGRFLGQRYQLVVLGAAEEATAAGAAAIVTAVDSAHLAGLAATTGLPVFNVGTTADADRALCLPHLFHIQPSEAMRAAALAQWLAADGADTKGGEVRGVAWNARFERYAASQLNKRYAETHGGEPMDDAAWAGWAAVKLYADAVARVGTDPARMLDFLREDLAFDGQKGVEMGFRSSGQLRQVILLERNGVVVGEAPVRGKDLDSLGGGDCPTP